MAIAPKYLGKIGKTKWRALVRELDGKPFDPDALGLLASTWETYLEAKLNLQTSGVCYRDSKGRVWNNPATNAADLALKQIIKLSKQVGIFGGGDDDGNPFDDDDDGEAGE